MNPKLIVEQKLTAFVNRYEIYTPNTEGEKDKLVAFAEQKRLSFKERVIFYSDPSKKDIVFSFRAEKVMDVHGRYFVEDASGEQVGVFKKRFGKSLINSTWDILDKNDQPVLTISENNQVLAIVRRFGGWIPIIGELIDIITAFLRYHFVFKTPDNKEVGMYRKTTLFFDRYRLEMTDEIYTAHDWQVLAAMAVALDALQSR